MKWIENILVLGKGYVGEHVSKQFSSARWVGASELNYHDLSVLGKFLLKHGITVIINCAGFTGRPNVDEAEIRKEECWNLNVVIPLKINQLCDSLGIKYIHISSGCIYNGYDKEYSEDDKPNFGMFDSSSFYSKSKHAFELGAKHLKNKILRIRMPVSPDTNSRNFLTKLKNYDNLVSERNSKTYLPDLCNFIEKMLNLNNVLFWNLKGDVYNVVNPEPLTTKQVVAQMVKHKYFNEKWSFVDWDKLNIVAPRSNCVLNCDKACEIYKMRNEVDILKEALNKMV